MLYCLAHGSAVDTDVQPMDRTAMEKNLAGLVGVITADFAHTIPTTSIRAEHDVPLLDSFRDRPQSSTRQPCADFRFVGVLCEVNGNELLIEDSPFLRQLVRQVLVDAEVCADEVPGEAFRCVNALLSQHDSVVAFPRRHANRTFLWGRKTAKC